MPIFLSPAAMQRLYHSDGDKASARAAEKYGTFYSMSSMGNNSIEEISNISSGPKLFQLYVHKDRSISDDLIDRSRRSGFDAMCLTVDTLVAGNREKDHRTGFTTPNTRVLCTMQAVRPTHAKLATCCKRKGGVVRQVQANTATRRRELTPAH